MATITVSDSANGLATATLLVGGNPVMTEAIKVVAGSRVLDFEDMGVKVFLHEDYSPSELEVTVTLKRGDLELIVGTNFDSDIDSIGIPSFEPEKLLGSTSLFTFSLLTQEGAQQAVADVEKAMENVDRFRALVGEVINHLEERADSIMQAISDLSSLRAEIRDTEFDSESIRFAKAQVMQNSALAIISHQRLWSEFILNVFIGR
jgi:flagellin-like hook-associated protein FlgL